VKKCWWCLISYATRQHAHTKASQISYMREMTSQFISFSPSFSSLIRRRCKHSIVSPRLRFRCLMFCFDFFIVHCAHIVCSIERAWLFQLFGFVLDGNVCRVMGLDLDLRLRLSLFEWHLSDGHWIHSDVGAVDVDVAADCGLWDVASLWVYRNAGSWRQRCRWEAIWELLVQINLLWFATHQRQLKIIHVAGFLNEDGMQMEKRK